MENSKDLLFVLNQLKNNYAWNTLTLEDCILLNNYIDELNKKNAYLEEYNKNLIEKIKEKSATQQLYNSKLIASWHQNRHGEIYKIFYIIYNGKVFNCQVYPNSENSSNILSVPTYLNADLQLFLRGKCGLKDLEEVDYITYKRCYSGV